jgi:hypothetical protein
MAAIKGPDVTKVLFGGVFDVDGSGHYPGLELINLVVCCAEGTLPTTERVHIHRVAHDFARQLLADKLVSLDRKKEALVDEHTAHVVKHLLRCLELEVPNTVKAKGWERTHFFPYTRSLVHWDSRPGRRGQAEAQLERRYLRGAGAYAFSVLRRDSDEARLQAMRDGFEALYPKHKNSPLEQLAATLKAKGTVDAPDAPSFDQIERESKLFDDEWEELFRHGMRNILSHRGLPIVQRVRSVMSWTSIWLVLMESARAASHFPPLQPALIVDCAGTHPQLRRAAQKCLKDVVGLVEQASRQIGAVLGSLSDQQLGKIRAFYGNTAAAGGLLNAWKGRRHFTLRLPALEALVLAAVPEGEEMEYDRFLADWLYDRCRIVAGRTAATKAGLLFEFDGTIFEENERRLADQMNAAGLLRVFSDATRMVSPVGRD